MLLSSVQHLLISRKMTTDAMLTDAQIRAEQVELYRRYYDGDHDQQLTPEMMKMLRITHESGDNFDFNYCGLVVDTEADRILVSMMDSDNDPATEWVSGVMERNGFDEMQSSVHQSALIDGNTFVMVTPDPETGEAVITHELAYDGVSGIVPIYKSYDIPVLDAVLKFWHVIADDGALTDNVRLNIYFEDRFERYISQNGAAFKAYENVETGENAVEWWRDIEGNPIGIPFAHFRNRKRKNYGMSEIDNVIGPQDALNREAYNIVISSELSAFMIRWVIGAKLKAQGIMPGMFLEIAGEGIDKDSHFPQVGTLEAGGPAGFLDAANWIIANLSKVSNTPIPDFDGGDNASGEALKARESRFIGKVKRFMTAAGASWEKVFDLAHKIESVYAEVDPPEYRRWITRWVSPEIRTDTEVTDNMLKLFNAGLLSKKTSLQVIAPIWGFDKAIIDRVLAELEDEAAERAKELAATVPGMGGFGNTDNPGENQANSDKQKAVVQSQFDNPTVQ